MIGFCDASQLGYSAVVYIHEQTVNNVNVNLVVSKTRVAPLKTLSIPRLELNGALLLSKLVESVKPALKEYETVETLLYTDSKTVLDWINKPSYKLKTYVANRVQIIQDTTEIRMWNHVSTQMNPADAPSRGQYPEDLANNGSWWKGPAEFRVHRTEFPVSNYQTSLEVLERKPEPACVFITEEVATDSQNCIVENIDRFSNINRVCRVVAHVLRFVTSLARRISYQCQDGLLRRRSSMKERIEAVYPSSEEIMIAKLVCVKATQRQFFSKELRLIVAERDSCNLRPLKPKLDEYGILRAGSRLSNSKLPRKSKYPAIIPKKCNLARLLVNHAHVSTLHSGPSTTYAFIVQEYSLIRTLIRKCITCQRFRPSNVQPIMSDLPAERVTPNRPFSSVGIDFAGPFLHKPIGIRSNKTLKGYLCLFVCFSTKAVHLEFVSSLETQSFLAALQRFISRRGLPSVIHSDNGTTFKAASKELKLLQNVIKADNKDIASFMSTNRIEWKFIPPYAPNFGSLWENSIKAAKSLLKKTIGNSKLNFEEYTTLFGRVEAILNSRPLTPMSADSSEGCSFLTPGHFLIGAPLFAEPDEIIDDCITVVHRWKKLKQMTQFCTLLSVNF